MKPLTPKEELVLYTLCIEQGVDLQFGKLSLCDLNNYSYSLFKQKKRRYQVHCDDKRFPWSMTYEDLGPAVVKFCEIKKYVRRAK